MKYIKLYEDFSDKVLDNLEDIKWIVVSFCDDRISYKLLTNIEDKIVIYSLSDKQTNKEEFESLGGRIKDLNPKYEYLVTKGKIAIGLPKYLKVFKELEKFGIENYTFNDDFSIDVNGDVNLYGKGLTKLPIKFRNVYGNFDISNNKLTSLIGSPKMISSYFDCRFNKLTSLEGCVEVVGDSFNCFSNKLTSLEGGPKIVGGDFYCTTNKLTSLKGSPEKVGGDFYCSNNKLLSLEYIGDVGGEIFSDF